MKKYILEAVVDGKKISVNREFNSRNSALNYMYQYYGSHFLPAPVINEEYEVDGNKHDIEYVSDYENRFRIIREIY